MIEIRKYGLLVLFAAGVSLLLPAVCLAAITPIEAQNIADEGRNFAKELKVIQGCSPGAEIAKPYSEVTLRHYLWKSGEERLVIFKKALETYEVSEKAAADKDCSEALFNAGKRNQSLGVELAVENANAELIPRRLMDGNKAINFGGEISSRVSNNLLSCIPAANKRRDMLKGFKPLILKYMQVRFDLAPGFEKGLVFSQMIDLFGYESDKPSKTSPPSKGICALYIFDAGQTVRLVEQLAELKPTSTGIWLDRRLRGN